MNVGLVNVFYNHGLKVDAENSEALPAPEEIDWIYVSLKIGAKLVIRDGPD